MLYVEGNGTESIRTRNPIGWLPYSADFCADDIVVRADQTTGAYSCGFAALLLCRLAQAEWRRVAEVARAGMCWTGCTSGGKNGVSESTMLALMGHMSRTMLERYSHIRMAAKSDAVAGSPSG